MAKCPHERIDEEGVCIACGKDLRREGIPEIKWGIFRRENGSHIAPCLNGELMEKHKLEVDCFCGPKVEIHPHVMIIIHEVIH